MFTLLNNGFTINLNNHYIIEEKRTSYPSILKVKILDITSTTILMENIDKKHIMPRMLVENFVKNWKTIEKIGEILKLY